MASQDIGAILDLYSSVFTSGCFTYSAAALVLYDHLITLDAEVRLFWTRKLSGASVLFFSIRYLALINYTIIGTVATVVPVSNAECANLIRATFTINVLQYIPWGAMSALRVLALSRMNWMLSGIVFILSEGPIVINLIQYGYKLGGENVLTTGCQGDETLTPLQGEILSAVSRTSVILADILVIAVTVAATWKRGAPRIGTSSLGETLLYNGIKYFAVLLCLNILAVVLTHLSIAIVAQQASYITGVAEPLTAIFISRLLLDLQAANRCGGPNSQILDSLSPNANGTLKFASVIGSLGTSEIPDAGNFEPDAVCSEGGEDGERYIDGSEDTPGRLESSTHA